LEYFYMKKTLVALAALAVSGASFAQVKLTGDFTWGYAAASAGGAATTVDTAGFGVDFSAIFIEATEDLGGGNSLTAKGGLDGFDRSQDGGAAPGGQDFSIAVKTGFGTFTGKTARNTDYLSEGIAAVGATGWIAQDGHVFSAHTNADSINYSYPIGAFTIGLQQLEDAKGLGEGFGVTGTAATTGQRRNGAQVTYSAGPLVANGGYYSYDGRDSTSATSESRWRLSGAYDLGVAKVGLGYDRTTKGAGATNADTYAALSVPVGAALELGINYANRTGSGYASAKDGTQTGYGLAAVYGLSKRTSLIARYRNWDASINPLTRSSDYAFYIDHTF
jgi:hypothetical protein